MHARCACTGFDQFVCRRSFASALWSLIPRRLIMNIRNHSGRIDDILAIVLLASVSLLFTGSLAFAAVGVLA